MIQFSIQQNSEGFKGIYMPLLSQIPYIEADVVKKLNL